MSASAEHPAPPGVALRRPRVVLACVLPTGCEFDGAYDLPLPGNKVNADDGYLVTADFADALNVVPRTAVMVDDVVVGQVTEVERVGWHARVKFLVRKDIKLPENVQVDVRQTSLLGEKYIALVEPEPATASAERLSAGDFIPLSRTGRNPEVEEVLGALSMLLSGGGIGQLKTISVELNNMLNGRRTRRGTCWATSSGWSAPWTTRRATSSPRWSPSTGSPPRWSRRRTHRRRHRRHGPGAEGAQPPARQPDEDAASARRAR